MAATQTQNPETAPASGHRGQAGAPGAPADGAPAARHAPDRARAGRASADRGPGVAASLRPLLIDIGIPVGTYYLMRDAFGLSLWLSLALSSIGPAVRSVAGLVQERKLNLLAVLILAVNLAGIGISFLSGDPRAMMRISLRTTSASKCSRLFTPPGQKPVS